MTRERKKGIVAVIVLIVIAIIILGYFGFDLRRIVESPQVQENLLYFWNLIKIPFIWLWNFITGLVEAFQAYLGGVMDGNSNILDPDR